MTSAGRGGCAATSAARLRPKASVLASMLRRSTCMVNVPSGVRFRWRLSAKESSLRPDRHVQARRRLSFGVDPADRFLTPLLEPEDLYAQLARQKLHRLVTQKPQNDLTLARHRPSLAKSQRACRPSLAWGKRWTSQARPHLPQAHQQQLSCQNYRSCSGPPWTLRLSQFVWPHGNRAEQWQSVLSKPRYSTVKEVGSERFRKWLSMKPYSPKV